MYLWPGGGPGGPPLNPPLLASAIILLQHIATNKRKLKYVHGTNLDLVATLSIWNLKKYHDLGFRKILLSSEISRQLVGYIDVNCWQHMDTVMTPIATYHARATPEKYYFNYDSK